MKMIIPCDFCGLAPAFCDGDEERCAVAFLTMQDNLTNHNNDVMRKTISFIVGEQEAKE